MTPNNDLYIESYPLSDPGKKRPNNEDYVTAFEPEDAQELQVSGRLYVVADGVGGAEQGERASKYAAQKVLFEYYRHTEMEPGGRLRDAIQQVGNEIYQYAAESRMATTMVAAVIRNNMLTVANVGDSRLYLIRAGVARQITRDHTLAGELLRDGEIREEDAQHVKGKNRLTRSLGGEPDVHVDIFANIPLQAEDKILLCTDGLSRYALSKDIAALTATGSPKEVTRQLIDFANQRGGADNVSVIFISVGAEQTVPLHTRTGTQAPPEPDHWDMLETQTPNAAPTVRVRKRKQSFIKGLDPQMLMLAAIPVLVICLFSIFGLLLILNKNKANHSTPTIETGLATSVTAEDKAGLPTAEGEIQPAAIVATETTSPSEAPTSTATPVPSIIMTTDPNLICVARMDDVKVGTLSELLKKFGIDWVDGGKYFYYKTCTTKDNTLYICKNKLNIIFKNSGGFSVPEIQANQFIRIDIPNENKIGNCISNKGHLAREQK
jgi:PPM family protein phosphatase